MKKTLNESTITNELRHGSSFFRKSTNSEPVETNNNMIYEQSTTAYDRTDAPSVRNQRPTERAYERTESPPPKRETKRHPFEIYKDQLERLKRLKAQAVLDGETVTMSEMVRVALDNYLQAQE